MVQVNIARGEDAAILRLLKLVEAGEEVVIARNRKAVARLVATTNATKKAWKPHSLLSMKGQIIAHSVTRASLTPCL